MGIGHAAQASSRTPFEPHARTHTYTYIHIYPLQPTLMDLLQAQHPDLPRHFSVFLSADASLSAPASELRLGGYDLGRVGRNASWNYVPLAEFEVCVYV